MHSTAYKIVTGTYEQARAMIGQSLPRTLPEFVVDANLIHYFASSIGDGNLSYWDDEFADCNWGGVISPPSMIASWMMPLPWRPDGARENPVMLATVPLPGKFVLNYSSDVEFLSPVHVGEMLSCTDTLLDVSPLKTTKVGEGHFVTTLLVIQNESDDIKARWTNVGYRYTPH